MVTVRVKGMSLQKFINESRLFYPEVSKVLVKKGKPIARYSGKTKKIRLFK